MSEPRLVCFGAVDRAAALCRVARAVGWPAYVVDPRAELAAPERFPDAADVVVAPAAEAFERLGGLGPGTAIAVLTHVQALDDEALLLALGSEAGFIGAMGSRASNAARRERLLAAGATEAQLARISAPIGLDIGGTTDGEFALSVVAEMVAARHGREGGRLVRASGHIQGDAG